MLVELIAQFKLKGYRVMFRIVGEDSQTQDYHVENIIDGILSLWNRWNGYMFLNCGGIQKYQIFVDEIGSIEIHVNKGELS